MASMPPSWIVGARSAQISPLVRSMTCLPPAAAAVAAALALAVPEVPNNFVRCDNISSTSGAGRLAGLCGERGRLRRQVALLGRSQLRVAQQSEHFLERRDLPFHAGNALLL